MEEELTTKKKGGSRFGWIFWWQIDKEDVKKQAENYNSLKLTNSSKGIASLLLIGSLVLSFIFSFIGWVSLEDVIISAVIYLPIIFFVYKGNRLAIVVMMIAWTIEKTFSLFTRVSTNFNASTLLITLAWWAIVMNPLYESFKVEQLRKRATKQNTETPEDSAINHHGFQKEQAQRQRKTMPSKMPLIIVVTLIFLISAVSAFYWFQFRPSKIKHDCSWVTTHYDEVPAKLGKTEEELFSESKLSRADFDRALKLARGEIQPRGELFNSFYPREVTESSGFQEFVDNRLKVLGENYLKQMQGTPFVEAHDEAKKATDEEYSFCLHDKGL